MLNGAQRLLFLLLNLFFGILPSFAFFEWIERNSSLPYVGAQWGWPWIHLETLSLPAIAAWNMALFFAFGFFHSLFAQTRIHQLIERIFPTQALRSIYMMITGVTSIALMGLWQNTGVVIWALPLGAFADLLISLGVFWGFMAASGWVMKRFDAGQFIGITQLYMSTQELKRTSGTPQLMTDGIFGQVRHPIYTFTFLAILLTPIMTLDRMLLAIAMTVYLLFAIPVEEKKLIVIFGPAYEDYRRRVPAVLPGLKIT